MDPKGGDRYDPRVSGQGLQNNTLDFGVLPSRAGWIECEVELNVKFNESEKLHNYQIDVQERDLTAIALQALQTPHFPIFQEIENIQKIRIDISENSSACMGRVFFVDAIAQNENGEERVGKFVIKASVDELRHKGGDLFAQSHAQELCSENGIRVPIVILPPEKKFESNVAFMVEEFIEGRKPFELSSEELNKIGFYEKLGNYLGRVHLIIDHDLPRQAAESLERESFCVEIQDPQQEVVVSESAQRTNVEERRLTHCDCHLGNVLIDKKGEVVVIDWGAAKFDTPYSDLQYLLIGSTAVKDTTHKIDGLELQEARQTTVPFGGGWGVVPRWALPSFLKGYISANQENIKDIDALADPVLKLKLLLHKSFELIEHAGWMDNFKPKQSEEGSQQEYFKGLCLNTVRQALGRISEVTSSGEIINDAKEIGKIAGELLKKIPKNPILDSITGPDVTPENIKLYIKLIEPQGRINYDGKMVEEIFLGLKKIQQHLSNF